MSLEENCITVTHFLGISQVNYNFCEKIRQLLQVGKRKLTHENTAVNRIEVQFAVFCGLLEFAAIFRAFILTLYLLVMTKLWDVFIGKI